jgi:tetratricopeptide (TPR) repeat protein
MARNLSTSEVARILGMKEASIREIVRTGLCRPARRGRRYAYSFQDLVVLRAARGLLEARVPAARVRRALAALAAELPEGRPLSGVRIVADGRQVAVHDAGGAWQPETGQTCLAFEVDGLARLAEAVRAERRPAGPGPGDAARAQLAFERGIDLEDEDPKRAAAAYREALALDPGLADALVNLGRLVHEGGEAAEAVRLYERALALTPDDPILHFNLALALEDARGAEAAAEHYERALALDPGFADAHWNLAGLCEALGRRAEALRHYRAYQKLTGSQEGEAER